MTVLKLSGCSQPWREWKRVGRFVFRQFNQWSFPSICQWPSFCKCYFLFPCWLCFISLHGRGQYEEGGSCKRFLSEEQVSHSAFLFTLVLRLNANGNYTFPRIVDTKFQNLQAVRRQQVDEFARRLIFPISQAVVAVSENSSSLKTFFKCHKTHFQSIAG